MLGCLNDGSSQIPDLIEAAPVSLASSIPMLRIRAHNATLDPKPLATQIYSPDKAADGQFCLRALSCPGTQDPLLKEGVIWII